MIPVNDNNALRCEIKLNAAKSSRGAIYWRLLNEENPNLFACMGIVKPANDTDEFYASIARYRS